MKRNKASKKMVMGELCESITLNTTSDNLDEFIKESLGTFYFNPKYKLNADLYKTYTNGFWNLYVDESKAISLRNELKIVPLLSAIQEAISLIPKSIPDSIFTPNSNKFLVLEE